MHCLERSEYFGHCREWLVVDKKCDESLQSFIMPKLVIRWLFWAVGERKIPQKSKPVKKNFTIP